MAEPQVGSVGAPLVPSPVDKWAETKQQLLTLDQVQTVKANTALTDLS